MMRQHSLYSASKKRLKQDRGREIWRGPAGTCMDNRRLSKMLTNLHKMATLQQIFLNKLNIICLRKSPLKVTDRKSLPHPTSIRDTEKLTWVTLKIFATHYDVTKLLNFKSRTFFFLFHLKLIQ